MNEYPKGPMRTIAVAQLKSEFSEVLQCVQEQRETYVVEYGRSHRKVAMIVPYEPESEPSAERSFGLLQGKASVRFAEDFAMTESELLGGE